MCSSDLQTIAAAYARAAATASAAQAVLAPVITVADAKAAAITATAVTISVTEGGAPTPLFGRLSTVRHHAPKGSSEQSERPLPIEAGVTTLINRARTSLTTRTIASRESPPWVSSLFRKKGKA